MPRSRPVVIATVASSVLASFALAVASPSLAHATGHRVVHRAARPAPVRDVATYVAGNTITVDWKNPGSAFDRVVVRYRKGATAPTMSGGSSVHLDAKHARSATLRHLTPDTTYSVAVWTKAGAKASRKRTATFTTDETDEGNGTYVATVTDTTGAPLAHAAVHLMNFLGAAELSGTTDHAGQLTRVLPSGQWLAVVDGSSATGGDSDATGYVGNTGAFRVRAGHVTAPPAVVLRPGAQLTGRVTDEAGEPLAGVGVYAAPPMPYALQDSGNGGGLGIAFDTLTTPETFTATDGTYRLRGIPATAVQVCFDPTEHRVTGGSDDAAGYLSRCLRDTVDLAAGAQSSSPDSQLDSAPGGALAGRVRTPSGKGARGVFVDAFKNDGAGGETETDATGHFYLGGLEPGRYRMCFAPTQLTRASRPGFRLTCPAKPLVVTASTTTTVHRALQRGGAITGTVTGPGGNPLSDINVYTRSGSFTTTDSRGHYTIAGVAPRAVRVCFDTSSTVPRKGTTGVRPGCLAQKIRAKTGRVRTGGDITLKRGAAVTGVITYNDGTPARKVLVDLEPVRFRNLFDGEAMTDKDGHYLIGGAPAGRYQVCVTLFDNAGNTRSSCRRTIRVTNGKFTHGVDKTLPAMGTIAATVQDETADPVAGVDVVVLKACPAGGGAICDHLAAFGSQNPVRVAATGMTSGNGRISYALLTPGDYAVCLLGFYGSTAAGAPDTGYADECTGTTFDVTVTADTTTPVAQTLKVAGAITGKVIDSAGHPIRGAVVHVSKSAADDLSPIFPFGLPNDPLAFSTTAADGTYTIRSVTPGKTTVCVDASGAKGGSSRAGYLDQCLGGEPGVPTGGTRETITASTTTTAPDIALTSAAAITGKITSTGRLGFAEVSVFDSTGTDVADLGIDGGGNYRITGLPAGTYRVCAQNNHDSRCYVDVPWTTRKPPANAKPVVTTAGELTTGIDVKMHG